MVEFKNWDEELISESEFFAVLNHFSELCQRNDAPKSLANYKNGEHSHRYELRSKLGR